MHDYLIRFVLLTASPWGMLELRFDVVPTSDSVPHLNLISLNYCYIFSLDPPRPLLPSSNVRCPSGRGTPLLPQHPLHRRPYCLHRGSSTHLGITCINPRILILVSSPIHFGSCPPSFNPRLLLCISDI